MTAIEILYIALHKDKNMQFIKRPKLLLIQDEYKAEVVEHNLYCYPRPLHCFKKTLEFINSKLKF